MRKPFTGLSAIVAGAAIACTGADAPTGPTPTQRPAAAAISAASRVEPADFSGVWYNEFTYTFTLDELISPLNPRGEVQCDSDPKPETYNLIRLEQDGARIVGASGESGGYICKANGLPHFYLVYDQSFRGGVHDDEIRFSLGKQMDVRATMDPGADSFTGTLRVRVDPSPYAKPFFAERRIRFWRWHYAPPPWLANSN
jgi:hypothetical protein